MRVRLASDLHTEFLSNRNDVNHLFQEIGGDGDIDILILAGDIATVDCIDRLVEIVDEGPWKEVLYVMGNHEYYGSSWAEANNIIGKACFNSNKIHLLNNSMFVYDGVTFVGTTLWFPDSPDTMAHRHRLNDFRHLSYNEIMSANRLAMEFIESVEADVLITHHGVSPLSINPEYRGEGPINLFYYTDISELISERQFKYCLHGHTHCTLDYMLGSARVMTNPRGYPSHHYYDRSPQNEDYNPHFTITID